MRYTSLGRSTRRKMALLMATSAIGIASTAIAQTAPVQTAAADVPQPSDIIVTATKRSERLQNVPISIQALGSATLEQHQVQSFDDYAKLLPSVSFQSFGPGQSQLYFRGVTSGGDGLHVGSQPATGLYLDEIPLTTIADNVDVHVYDISRVEALSGPQGTLYGASSLSGTLRIITNQPDTTKFSAGYDLDGNKFGKGAVGGTAEGFVNIPLSDRAAIRLVGFYEHDGGYIDNTYKQRTFVIDPDAENGTVTVDNSKEVKKNFNDVNTYGGRAALKLDLSDNWTATPAIIYQHQKANGTFLYDAKNAGDLQVHDFLPEHNLDHWYQASLTIQGKISDWDVTYAGGYFGRSVDNVSDYSYYAVDYAVPSGYDFFPTADGHFLDPTQQEHLHDRYTKQSHELRISSPADKSLRLTAGMFYERQTDAVTADYFVAGSGSIPTVSPDDAFPTAIPGFGDDVFATRIKRVDKDTAAFGDLAYDIFPNLTLDGGVRVFATRTTANGFSGFQCDIEPDSCDDPTNTTVTPNVNKHQDETGETHKVNLSWKVTPDKLVYVTYSTGFRPGGINRRIGIVPFKSDTLDNFEIGWKTSWFDHHLRVNAAAFIENWKNIQFGLSPVGSNGVTNTYNAGNARVHGIEGDFDLRLGGLEFSGGGTYIDAKLTSAFCAFDDLGNSVCEPGVAPAAAKGTRLPIQPKLKGNITARYNLTLGDVQAFVQGTANHQSGTRTFLTDVDYAAIGPTRGFTTFDFSVGGMLHNLSMQVYIQNAFDKRGQLSRNTACAPSYCGADYRIYPIKPQLFGVKLGEKF